MNKIIWLPLISSILLLAVTSCASPMPIETQDPATPHIVTATAIFTPTPTATATLRPTDIPTETSTSQPSATPFQAFAIEVIALVNQERALREIAALEIDPELMESADAWSQFMAANDSFYHSDDASGENIGAGYSSPEEVVAGWMDSPGHRANILNPEFTGAGVGYASLEDSTYKHYWTLQFRR